MRWQERAAPHLDRLRRKLRVTSEGHAIIAEQPEQDDAMALCITAWADLDSCRQIGMSVGPIPWTAIVEWCRYHRLDREASRVVQSVIRRLDVDRAEREARKEHR